MGRPPTYTQEFRSNAVEYVVSTGKTYAEAAELRARVRELEMENEFLNKAAAFFAARQA